MRSSSLKGSTEFLLRKKWSHFPYTLRPLGQHLKTTKNVSVEFSCKMRLFEGTFNHCVLFEIVKVEFLVCATYFSHIFHYLLQCVKMYDFTTRKSEDETKQMSFWLS